MDLFVFTNQMTWFKRWAVNVERKENVRNPVWLFNHCTQQITFVHFSKSIHWNVSFFHEIYVFYRKFVSQHWKFPLHLSPGEYGYKYLIPSYWGSFSLVISLKGIAHYYIYNLMSVVMAKRTELFFLSPIIKCHLESCVFYSFPTLEPDRVSHYKMENNKIPNSHQ